MKFILTALFLTLAVIGLDAQSSAVEWTDAFEPKGTSHLAGIYSNGEKTTLVFTDNEADISKINVVFTDAGSSVVSVFDYTFKEPVHAIVGGYNKENSFVIFHVDVKNNEGEFTQEIKSLEINRDETTEENTLAKFVVNNKAYLGKPKFAQSPDLKKNLLFVESPYTSGQKEEISFFIYDENGNQEHNSKTQLNLDSKQNVHNYPQIANDGTVYFLKKDKEKNAVRYFIYSYNYSTKNVNQKQILLSNAVHITDIKGQVTEGNEFLVGGFTASSPEHVYEGYYLLKFDHDCIQKYKTQAQFDENTFLRFLSKKEYSKDPVIKDFYIDDITILPTGKIFMAAECYREEKAGDVTWTNYKDIMLMCFDETGKYKTTFKYSKNQSQQADNSIWASYKIFPDNDTLVIAHNYIVKVEGVKKPEPLFTRVNIHEKYGAKPQSSEKTGKLPQALFFVPELVYNPGKKQCTVVFADINRNKFRIGTISQ